MAISVGGAGAEEKPMSDINTTPLVDVMLVLLIIFLIAVPVAIQTIEKLHIPVMASVESKDKVENLLLTVSTSDSSGRSAGDPGFEGASTYGECRIYFNNITPVDSNELRDLAFKRLDAIVKKAGGPEALVANPELVPQVHIRGDVNAPWRCIAGAIFNVQISGYPTVGFISTPVDPNG
ncbi:MAG: biopolymer transporter ExbD [Novosphingobium sp.]|jgi:biopolymer transport protein ExbD|uniref:ExbD/TolR family protein n=1 Tax=Novosphingobium sp. TaxID=1874826 RepID=UPI001DF40880|nr:biopolymer transporter ExbD [Novosphingobium sp.]MCB2058512.1 biopolymer transporter ExbD [Novosphingobium sp.]MCP5386215.1 biopolymer transporter ExbD [Novosphingobium sp.]HNJ48159.1 biopolymer transporter ExbD [Novosphingobium sp.]